MECSRACLSMPEPMVALPCGSRSISRTRRLVATSEAARLMQVVVLPTPPFWLAIAKTLAMRRVSPQDRATQYQQMALALATRDLQDLAALHMEIRRQHLQLVIRLHALHGQPAGLGVAKVT